MSKINEKRPIISSLSSLKYFKSMLYEQETINVLSDLKHRIFPRPFERLSKLRSKKGLVGAEIGVCGGEHVLSLLRTFDIKKLYLIDPYSIYEDYDEGRKYYGADQASLIESELAAKKILSDYASKIVWIKDLSENATNLITEQLDFVYIDGNHAKSFVKQDIELFYPLVKSGGVIGGHDFYNGYQFEHDGVINAVVEWVSKNNKQLKVELADWWVEK